MNSSNKGLGLYEQIKSSYKVAYNSLKSKDIEQFLLDIQTLKYNDRKFIYNIGEFQSRYLTATFNKDKATLDKLNEELYIKIVKDLLTKSSRYSIDFDLLLLLEKEFKSIISFDSLVWEVAIKYYHRYEYDDLNISCNIRYNKGKWYKEYYSEEYGIVKTRVREITEKDILDIITRNK